MKTSEEKKNITFLCDVDLAKQVKTKCSQEGIGFHDLLTALLDAYNNGIIEVKVKKTFEVKYTTNLIENTPENQREFYRSVNDK